MTKRQVNPPVSAESRFFAKELAGETPPDLASLGHLYRLASLLFAQRPWQYLDEEELVLAGIPGTDETCYCSVMGALGEVLAIHAYVGDESYRLFRAFEAEEVTEPLEFFCAQRSVSVEFVPTSSLEAQDRKLLAALGHPLRSANVSPVFRAIRPGYQPWFITEEEAHTLAECLNAVLAICAIASSRKELDWWDRKDWYPRVARVGAKGPEPQYGIEIVHAPAPAAPPLEPAPTGDAQLRQALSRDYPVKGVLELDCFFNVSTIGKKYERKSWARTAMAVDAATGIVFPPEFALPGASEGTALLGALTKAIQSVRAVPREIRVQSGRYRDCLAPVAERLGCRITVASRLPALANARDSLRQMMGAS